ncbi:hypothetical protein HQ545_00055 [Candidatus Woesearchaeota archaeon]|nr:hypothetical protein [Candidatus Woesearchaeota archaeon]
MELPQYTLKPDANRMVAPRIIMMLLLSAFLYIGVRVNFFLIGWDVSIPTFINIFILVLIAVIAATQVILYHIKFAQYKYLFYTNRVEFNGKKTKTFLFSDFSSADLKQGLFDKMFNTGSIRLSKEFSIGPVAHVTQMNTYLEQLIKYYHSSQGSYNLQQQQSAMKQQLTGGSQ